MTVRDLRVSQWYWVDNRITDIYAKKIGVVSYAVYQALCRHAGMDGKCWPSAKTISQKLGISDRSFFRSINVLVENQLIGVESGTGNGVSNIYTLLDLPYDTKSYGSDTKSEGGMTQSLTNNTYIRKNNNNIGSLETKQQNQYNAEANFDLIYNHYPRKMGRRDALRHFQASIKTEQDLINIQDAIDSYNTYITVNKIEEKFIKHASSWFRNWPDWVGYNKKQPSKSNVGAAGRLL